MEKDSGRCPMLISGLYTHSFSYTRIVGSGWGIKVITEVTQTLTCSLPVTVKMGHEAAHPRLLCPNTMITLCQVDNRTQTHSDLRTKMSVDIQEDSQPGASRPTPGNHHPCTHNSHNTCTKPKGKLPKKIEFLGSSPAPAPSHQS